VSHLENEKRDFNKEAVTWDEPRRARMAADIADAIFEAVPVQTGMNVLDFGCGTGLLTLCFQPFVSSITGIDSSRGMLEVLDGKIRDRKLSNVKTLLIDPDNGARLEGRFDLITSSMAVHHVMDVSALLDQFYRTTAPGGYLCIADLDPESGLFHAENHQGVFHDGFDRNELHKKFIDAGYKNISDMTATKVVKPVPGGTKEFTIFLMTGHKKP
jgi:ubiquinone/menaquinone biosynthesis C-methylase UbiE